MGMTLDKERQFDVFKNPHLDQHATQRKEITVFVFAPCKNM